MVLEVITGPMFSGKSEELIRRVRRAVIAGQKVQVFKPALDHRRGVNYVSTFDNIKIDATPLDYSEEILTNIKEGVSVIGIDELHFFDDTIIEVIDELCSRGLRVIVTCLNLDFRAEPFPFRDSKRTVAEVVLRADQIDKISSICTYNIDGKICGKQAVFSQRIINGKPAPYDAPTILIGAEESYSVRCRDHYFIPGKVTKPLSMFQKNKGSQ